MKHTKGEVIMYSKNIALLKKYNPMLEVELESVISDDIGIVDIEEEVIFKLTDDQGKEFFTGSIYDPKYEAECLLNKVNKDNTGYLVLGLTGSSLVRKILELTIDTSWVIIVEPDKRVVKAFLESYDLSKFLDENNNRLIIATGPIEKIKDKFLLTINSMVGYYLINPEIIKTFSVIRSYTTFFEEVLEMFKDVIVNFAYNTGNDLDDTLLGIKNEIRNLYYVFNRPALKEIKGCLKGKTVICVSSGPSLDKQIDLLKKVQGKAVIICAESAFKALLAHRIKPDIVCILERGENSLHFSIEGVEIPENSYLFGLTVIEPQIFKIWGERAVPCFKDNLTYSNELNNRLGDFGKFTSGNSVAHFNLMLSNYLGAEKIILLGQDLAFSDSGEHHSKSTPYSLLTEDEERKFQLRLEESATVYLDGYYGEKVKSKKIWKQFLIWFEILLTQVDSKVYNATEGGALIKGAENTEFYKIVEEIERNESFDFAEIIEGSSIHKSIYEKKDEVVNIFSEFNDVFEIIYKYSNKQKRETKTLLKLLDVFNMEELLEDIKSTLSNNEMKVFRKALNNEYSSFYFAPLITEMHIRINPISRISSKRKLQEILYYQLLTIEKIEKYSKKYIDMVKEELHNLQI
jgi:hypothetical protein